MLPYPCRCFIEPSAHLVPCLLRTKKPSDLDITPHGEHPSNGYDRFIHLSTLSLYYGETEMKMTRY